jgi:hypothetical protein
MSRYWKYWVAVAGVLAQLLVAVEAALDVGAIPEGWRPWVVVVIAVATALGVRKVENAPMTTAPARAYAELVALADEEARRRGYRGDGGYARPRLLWGALLPMAAVLAVAASGAPAQAHGPVAPLPVITDIEQCDGVLTVDFTVIELEAGRLTVMHDPGDVFIELHHVGSAAGPGGKWSPPERLGAGNGQALADVAGLPTWDLARVTMPYRGQAVASDAHTPEPCA